MINFSNLKNYIAGKTNFNFFLWPTIITALLLSMLLVISGTDHIGQLLGSLKPGWIILILPVFLLLMLTVTYRLYYLLQLTGRKDYLQCLDTSILHVLLLTLLPARIGDICYPFLLKNNLSVEISAAVGNLFLIRLYDLMTIAVLFILSLVILQFDPAQSRQLFLVLVLSVACMALFIIFILFIRSRGDSPETEVTSKIGQVSEFIQQVKRSISIYSQRQHIILSLLTVIRWLLACIVFLLIFQSLALDISAAESILVTTGINLSVLIPIQTMGGFGITEVVLSGILKSFGNTTGFAIAVALTARLVWITFPLLIAAGWFGVRVVLMRRFD